MRVFLALDLPDAVIGPLVRLQAGLRTGRKVPADHFHLTLAFLDEVDDAVLEDLHAELSETRFQAVELTLRGVDMFGDGGATRTVFAQVVPTPALTQAHDAVARAVRRAGLQIGRQRFRPHVTLARFGRTTPVDQTALAAFLADGAGFAVPGETARAVTLYASTLHPDGAQYDALAVYPMH